MNDVIHPDMMSRLRETRLATGHRVRVHRSQIVVSRPDGGLEIALQFTPDGVRLQLPSGRLEMEAPDALAIRCRSFEVDAEDQIALRTHGDVGIHARGEVAVEATTAAVTTQGGDVSVDARNGDVRLDGTRLLLNCEDLGGQS